MRPRARHLMGFPLPLPDCCRGHGKWKREAVLIVICPRAPKPAAVLAAVKDKPLAAGGTARRYLRGHKARRNRSVGRRNRNSRNEPLGHNVLAYRAARGAGCGTRARDGGGFTPPRNNDAQSGGRCHEVTWSFRSATARHSCRARCSSAQRSSAICTRRSSHWSSAFNHIACSPVRSHAR